MEYTGSDCTPTTKGWQKSDYHLENHDCGILHDTFAKGVQEELLFVFSSQGSYHESFHNVDVDLMVLLEYMGT